MNTFYIITFISYILAILSIVTQFTKNVATIMFIFFLSVMFFVLCYFIERKLRKTNSSISNRILYYLSIPTQDYYYIYEKLTYTYFDYYKMEFESSDFIKSLTERDDISGRYKWSSFSDYIQLEAIRSNQLIAKEWKLYGYSHYTVKLDKMYKKGEVISTGFRIKNLIDTLKISEPFLAIDIKNKMKKLELIVEMNGNLKAINARFQVFNSDKLYFNPIVDETLEKTHENNTYYFKKTIPYPRKGWSYAIVWEWENQEFSTIGHHWLLTSYTIKWSL